MGQELHLDYETFSRVDIRKAGAYRYAADPSTRVILCAVSTTQSEEVLLWMDPQFLLLEGTEEEQAESDRALALIRKAVREGWLIYAHNAEFERAVSMYRIAKDLGVECPTAEQWRCTAAMCRRAALPAKLEKIAEVLGLEQQKDKRGAALIRKFSMPQKSARLAGQQILPTDAPEEFREFGDYCRQDVRTEKAVHKRLYAFELKGDTLRTFQLDVKLNDRGIPVNVSALRNAQKLVNICDAKYSREFEALTGLRPTQRDKILQWLREHGYPGEDLQSKTVSKYLALEGKWGNATSYKALQLRELTSYMAVKKIATMLICEWEGIVRGTLLFYGASTGRWSGRLVQPQNFKRPTIQDTDLAYQMICDGCSVEDLEMVFGNPLEVISSCIRHFIQMPEGDIFDADYAAIEARIVCWLAGQEDALERFRKGIDSYVDMAAFIFSKDPKKVTKDERWLGKQTVLGCGFNMGPDKFYDQCIDLAETYHIEGIAVTEELCRDAVFAFRDKYDRVRSLWYVADNAARNAILHPGKRFKAGEKLWFCVIQSGGIPFLVMKLPSGRNIVYPWPKLEATRGSDRTNITFFGQIPASAGWGRVKTYGGKLVENATQATAADVMANGAANAMDDGFDLLTLIHDEALAAADERPVEDFCFALTDLPDWANGLPVAAEGKVIPYYKKV